MTGYITRRELSMYRTQGLDVQISVKALAGCGPSEERNEHLPVMEFPARNERHATQQEKKKQRGKTCSFCRFMQEMKEEGAIDRAFLSVNR